MKKRITLLLASALLLSTVTACNTAPKNDAESSFEDTNTTESAVDETKTETEEENNEEVAPIYIVNQHLLPSVSDPIPSKDEFKDSITCNGVYYNSTVFYTISPNNHLFLYIEEWDEYFVIPYHEEMRFIGETLHTACVVMDETHGTLFFNDFSPTASTYMIRFTKGSDEITIGTLSLEADTIPSYKCCNFIKEKTGYLFLFGGSDIELSKLLKTTNGGQTWIEQPLENTPSLYWKAEVICAKMINESVGFISGSHWADDNMSARTYITTDGGKNWSQVVLYPNETSTNMPSIEAFDLTYEDGKYILCFKRAYGKEKVPLVQYSSSDLKAWTVVE